MRDYSSVKCFSQSINRRRRWVELLLAHDRSFSFTSNFFFSNYLSFLLARSMYHNDWRLTRSDRSIYKHIPVSPNGKKRRTELIRQGDISTLVECSSGLHLLLHRNRGEKKKKTAENRNDVPFCFFNQFIVRILFWYSFFFSFCLYRILF